MQSVADAILIPESKTSGGPRARTLAGQRRAPPHFGTKETMSFPSSHVSLGPPIIPDGGFSPVRLEAKAFLEPPSRGHRWVKPVTCIHQLRHGLLPNSPGFSLLPQTTAPIRAVRPRGIPGRLRPGPLCRPSSLPGGRGMSGIPSADITPPSSLRRAHAPVPGPPAATSASLIGSVLAACVTRGWSPGTFPTLSLLLFPGLPRPVRRRFRRVHLTSSSPTASAITRTRGAWLPLSPTNGSPWVYFTTLQTFLNVTALQVVSPPGRSVPLQAASEGVYFRACWRFVASSPVGYSYPADWPIAGAGLAPAREAALSAASRTSTRTPACRLVLVLGLFWLVLVLVLVLVLGLLPDANDPKPIRECLV